jgi:TP901 family phage tail tape measure protein
MAGREIVNRQLNIYIQSGDAQKAYDKLIAKEKTLNEEIAKTTDPKRIQKLKDELNKLVEPLDRAAKKVKGELEPSLKDTAATVGRLRNEISRMSESDADFHKINQQLRQGNVELEQQRSKVGLISKAWKSFWQEAKTVAAGVIIGNTIQAALQTVLGYVTGIVTGSAKISDELADIQRVTGLTSAEVKTINSELKKIDTRTSVSALRDIVLIAGKLGIEKENILGFAEAVDKLNVALGGELGDVETFTTDLGKILNVFEGKITGENVTHLGNAIVDLANKGVASGPFLVDFTQRVSGIAKASNLSLHATLGLGAGLEETGNKVESSATAIQKLITSVGQDIPKAAKIAGVEASKFAETFANAPEEALLLFAAGLQKNKSSFAEIAKGFKDAGEDGARVISVLSVLGQKTEFFRDKIKDAGVAIQGTGQITDAFNLKNKNAGAELDKFKKNFASLFTSNTFQEAGAAAIKVLNGFVNLVKAAVGFVREHGLIVSVLGSIYLLATVRIKGLTIAQVLNNTVTKLSTFISTAAAAAYIIFSTAASVLTGRIKAATGAQIIWQTVMAAGRGGLGLIVVAIGAVALGISALLTKTKQLSAAQKITNEIEEKATETYASQIAALKQKIALASNENVSLATRKKALEEVKAASDGYLKNLTLENINTSEGITLVDLYTASLKASARARAAAALAQEKETRAIQLETKLDVLNTKFDVKNETGPGAFIKNLFAGKDGGTIGNQIRDARNELAGVNTELSALYAKIAISPDLQQAIAGTDANGNSIKPGGKSPLEVVKEKTSKTVDDLLKDLQKIKDDLRLSQLSPLDRDLAELDIKFEALRKRAGTNGKLLLIIDQLYQESRLRLIQEYARKEVAEWQKAGEDVNKKADEQYRKNLAALAALQKKLDDELQRQFENGIVSTDKDRLAKRELQVLISRGEAKLKAELSLLNEQERQELSAKNLTENEKFLIEERYRQKRKQAEIDHVIGIIEISTYFLQGLENIDKIFSDAKTAKENQELARDQVVNDQKKTNLERRLKAGLITQLQYDRELEKMDRERQRKEKIARKAQFERDKRAQFVAALISNAGAVSTTLQKFGPPIPPNFLGIAAMGLTILTGIAQLATIAGSKAPEFGGGGKLGGNYHSEGGNPILDRHGKKIGEIEKDEGIINRFTMGDRSKYTVTGTPSQIASRLNSMHGVSWEAGATLRPAWRDRQPARINYQAIQKHYAAGGRFNKAVQVNADSSDASDALLLLTVALQKLNAKLDIPLKAYTLLTDHETQQARLNAIRQDATLQG